MNEPHPEAPEAERRLQADPELDMSGGRASTLRILFAAIGAIAIVIVTFYGLTHHRIESPQTAGAPAAETAGAAPPATPQEGKGNADQAQQGKQEAPQGDQAAKQQGSQGGADQPGQQSQTDHKASGSGAPQTTGAAPTDSRAPDAAPPAPSDKASQGGPQQKKK